MTKPIQIKLLSPNEVIKRIRQKDLEAEKKLKENKGRCIKCNKNMANLNSPIDQFQCNECNKETEDLLKQLRGPGFLELKVPLK